MEKISQDWLSVIKEALAKANLFPVLEESFPFPWVEAAEAIASALELPELDLSPGRIMWRSHEKFLQSMGKAPHIFSIELSPIEGPLFFVMSKQDVAHFTSELLSSEEHKSGFSSPILQQGFYHFVLLKVARALDSMSIFKELSPQLTLNGDFPEENGFCIDVSCTLSKKTLQGRVICPSSFLTRFRSYEPLEKKTLLSLNEEILITLRAEIGRTAISAEEWEKVGVGDFIILDRCTYSPEGKKGSITFFLENTPLLIGRIKPQGAKILDYVFYEEKEEPLPPSSFTLTAEIGRLDLSLDQLIHLAPNKLLPLSRTLEQDVDLMSGDKKVGKGELLRLGEVIGIRMLSLE